jgi:hypothetical protein
MEHLDLPLMGGARNGPASAPPARIQLECRSSNMSLLPRSQRPVPRTENPRRKTPEKTSLSPITPLEQIRVIIADDHPVVREGLSSILSALEDVQVVAEAANGKSYALLIHALPAAAGRDR